MKSAPLLIAAILLYSHSFLAANEKSAPSEWITTDQQWAALRQGEVVLLDSNAGGKERGHSATAAILVGAPPKEVWDVVFDGNTAADFQASLVTSTIVERSAEFTLVEQVVKVGLHKVKYVVRQAPAPPSLIDFSLESGELEKMDGFWRFLSVGDPADQKTLLVYRLSLEPLIPIPRFMIRKSITNNLPDTLRSVRDETIRRSTSP